MRAIARIFVAAIALTGSACLKSTEPQPSVLQLSGDWKYAGMQTAPLRETLAGTLTISRESGTSFEGTLQLNATNEATGQSTSFSGLVNGAESGTNVIDFTANFDTDRRHVGQIVADTITGNWVGSTPNGTMSSGTFRIEREPR